MEMLQVARLESLGFFRHVRAADLDRVRAEMARSAFQFPQETRRRYHADAEELAERGVLDFLGEVAPFLRHEGVPIEVTYRVTQYPAIRDRPAGQSAARLDADGWIDESNPYPAVASLRVAFRPGGDLCEVTEDDWDSGAYGLFAGEREIVIYREEDDGTGCDDWDRATVATRALLDELLEAHASAERAYADSRGNDLDIVFATPAMARLINAAVPEPRARLHDGVGNEAT